MKGAGKYEVRYACGLVPTGTLFPSGSHSGVTPNRLVINLPMNPAIPVDFSAEGINKLERLLVDQMRDFVRAIARHKDIKSVSMKSRSVK